MTMTETISDASRWPDKLSGHDAIDARIAADLPKTESRPLDGLVAQHAIDIVTQAAIGIDKDMIQPDIEQLHRDVTTAIRRGDLVLPEIEGMTDDQRIAEYIAQLIKGSLEPGVQDALVITSQYQRQEMNDDFEVRNRQALLQGQTDFERHQQNQLNKVIIHQLIELARRELSPELVAKFEKIASATKMTVPDYVSEESRIPTDQVEVIFQDIAKTALTASVQP